MTDKASENRFLLLQLNDSVFPIGAYAHSYGLETYIQKGVVHDEETAAEYLRSRLGYGFLYTDLLAVRLAWDAAKRGDVGALCEIEDMLEASRVPEEIRAASEKMGRRFVKTILYMEPKWESEVFKEYLAARKGESICHPCAYGAFCAQRGIARRDALEAFLYAQASAAVTNCVKTIPLSQSAGQEILLSLYPLFSEIIERAQEAKGEMLGASAPGADIRSIQHERLYSRLYMS